jgi:SHS family lactate transporter-like MFS transporter
MTDITPNEVQPKSATLRFAASPDAQERMSIGRYFHAYTNSDAAHEPGAEPFKALTLLNRQQWLFFSVW